MSLWPNQWFEELGMKNIKKQFSDSSFSDMYLQKPEKLLPVKCICCGEDLPDYFYKESDRYMRIIDISLPERDNVIYVNEKNKALILTCDECRRDNLIKEKIRKEIFKND